jgi:hypothetical protein
MPVPELTLRPGRAAADPAWLQIRQHGRHHLVRAEPLQHRRPLETRMPVAGGAVQPYDRPIDVGEGVGAFGHVDMLRPGVRRDLAAEKCLIHFSSNHSVCLNALVSQRCARMPRIFVLVRLGTK